MFLRLFRIIFTVVETVFFFLEFVIFFKFIRTIFCLNGFNWVFRRKVKDKKTYNIHTLARKCTLFYVCVSGSCGLNSSEGLVFLFHSLFIFLFFVIPTRVTFKSINHIVRDVYQAVSDTENIMTYRSRASTYRISIKLTEQFYEILNVVVVGAQCRQDDQNVHCTNTVST